MHKMTCQKISPKIVLAAILLFILTGCMVGPDYQRPAVDMPQNLAL